jgi:predicted  nucleic acid-binding Zn-ribbon protein
VSEALDAVERAAQAPPQIDDELSGLAGRLNDAFVAATSRIEERSRRVVEAAHRDLEAQRSENEAQRTELDAQRTENDALTSSVAMLEDELRGVRQELELEQADLRETRNRVSEAEVELARACSQADSSFSRIVELEEELRDARRTLQESLEEVSELGARLEEVAGEKGRLSIELSAARGELQMAQAQREAVAAQLKASVARAHMLERSQADRIGQLQARLDAPAVADDPQPIAAVLPASIPGSTDAIVTGDGEAARLAATVEASVRSVETLTRASNITDLLGGLAQQLSAAFSRVAVFRVQANRLQGEQQVGFDYTTEVRKIAMPLNVDSLLTRVVRTAEMERLTPDDLANESKGAPFRGRPTLALALPIVLHGDAVAVAYLDDWDHTASATGRGSDESSVLFARLVVRHAGVLFISYAHEMRVLTELREYASLLLQGAEQMYAADADARMTPEALQNRLEDNLACARQMFAQRASLEGPVAAGLLEEQLAARIEADPSLPFVRDLVAIAVRARESDAQRSAEAC